MNLGAHRYLDSESVDPAAELASMGGAKVILATAPSGKAIAGLLGGLDVGGKIVAVGASTEPLGISPAQLIARRLSLQGWPSGTSKDSEDTPKFSALTGIRPMVEEFALEDAARGYDRMMSNQARFRVVLVSR